jgi:serine/threonine protein kinase
MSQRFFRCPHCRLPHDEGAEVCPVTGRTIEARRAMPSSMPPPGVEEEILEYLRGERGVRSDPPRRSDLPSPSDPLYREPAVRSIPPPVPSEDDFPRALPEESLRPQERSRIGEVLGGVYAVRGVLGRGATAIVYEGEHQVLGRRVALKVMTDERVQSQEARRRFLQEAQAAASLSHANICQIYDLGSLPDGAMFCAMEYLQGEPLSTRLEREGALPLVDVVEFGLQILMGLHAAHRKGIIHRDIKPENVFLAQIPGVSRPVVKLLDFGLAKMMQPFEQEGDENTQITQITRTGVVVGTPYYMAPEAVTGQKDLDLRVDLWATGVVLFFAAAGRLPFRGSNWADTAQAILQREVPSLRGLRPSAPARLIEVIERALRKDRAYRYSSAMDFARELVQVRRDLYPRS